MVILPPSSSTALTGAFVLDERNGSEGVCVDMFKLEGVMPLDMSIEDKLNCEPVVPMGCKTYAKRPSCCRRKIRVGLYGNCCARAVRNSRSSEVGRLNSAKEFFISEDTPDTFPEPLVVTCRCRLLSWQTA